MWIPIRRTARNYRAICNAPGDKHDLNITDFAENRKSTFGNLPSHDRSMTFSQQMQIFQEKMTPGFINPRGSHASLIARMAAISATERDSPRWDAFSRPMPCSAEIDPP